MKDTYENLICPACGTPMKKIYINNKDLFLDVCLDGCGGIWFDNRELQKFDEKAEDITAIKNAYAGKTFKKIDKTVDRKCPKCHKNMVKNSVSAKQEISIDECYFCGGKFFDYQELEQMRNQYNSDEERIADIKELAKDSLAMELILNKLVAKDAE